MMSSGTASAMVAVDFITPMSDIAASVKPKNSAPESPMKMEAGWKLYRRNADTRPDDRGGKRGRIEPVRLRGEQAAGSPRRWR